MIFLWIYLLLCNSLLFVLMRVDKQKAIKHQWRIPEKTLLFLDLIGGGIGGILGMRLFRHKTTKISFKFTFALGTLLAVLMLVYVNY
ncbi:DUF1294 domain-containing protein [Carnobacterium inhibens]|uniref:DUF1294 domain-containing protein n=1 Tax=Carnobacterium inhibens TaxID=147709 RepID=A0ABR7TAA8_9LACT|nr:DUF1294 domain-containing protein [Carnobacterium inhibens]MBC9824869.1 DUF1294 domain-containing protein [Carnobacterium inhibens]